MAKKSKIKSVETLTHEEATRKNIPSEFLDDLRAHQ
jgi:hypothetical protein